MMRGLDVSLPVLVAKPTRGLAQHGVLGIARSLGRLGVPVYWAHNEVRPPAGTSRFIRGTFNWTFDESRPAEAIEKLLEIGRKLGRRSILITTDDGSSVLVAENAELLREQFIFPIQPPGLVRDLANKRTAHDLCVKFGVPVPRTAFPESDADVRRCADIFEFPVVLKRAAGWLPARVPNRKSVVIATDLEGLLAAYAELENPDQPNTLLQEYLPGGSESIWMFNGYFDEQSDCLLGFTGQKIRQLPPNSGPTTLGICAPNDIVFETTRTLMKSVGYRGILDIGYRHDTAAGDFKLLDINPRIGSTFRLFVGEPDLDVARALYLDLTGQSVPESRALSRRKWVDEPLDLVSSVRTLRGGDLTVRNWFHSLRGVRERAWFALDDPLPGIAVWIRYAPVAFDKIGLRIKRRRSALSGTPGQAEAVTRHFDAASDWWDEIYSRSDVNALIHQERQSRCLEWIDRLGLPSGTSVLEVGCGAGSTAVALAKRGFEVEATDPVPRMIERTREKADAEGVADRLRVRAADAQSLDFPDETFDVAVALGVIPWLEEPATAIRELSRVLKPGGVLIVNADNRLRLVHLVDPRRNPWLQAPRKAAKRGLGRLGIRRDAGPTPAVVMFAPNEFDDVLRSGRLEPVSALTLGFGPFTFWNREAVPARLAVRLHRWLQKYADRRVPGVHLTGAQYLVLARKLPAKSQVAPQPRSVQSA